MLELVAVSRETNSWELIEKGFLLQHLKGHLGRWLSVQVFEGQQKIDVYIFQYK